MTDSHSYPVTDTAAFQNTDDADAVTVLAAVRHCANSWEGGARLLGNVRARDIARACTLAIGALSQPVSVDQGRPDREPDAWEWRACIGGRWGAWLYLDQPIERFSARNAFNLDNGTYEIRPLYALPSTEGK